MAYQTKNWTAVQGTDLIGSQYTLTLSGQVEVLKSSEEPHLAEAKPQGINPTELVLDMAVTGADAVGGHVVLWKTVSYSKPISSGQYHRVLIRQQNGPSDTINVEQQPS